MFRQILAVETSCDDTSVALVAADGSVRALVSAHQNKAHEAFGGVVPEIASRNHTHHLLPLIDRCLESAGLSLADVDGFAVTSAPGLIGSLLVGLVTVKTLALLTGKPFIGVNHLEGHLLAPFLRDDSWQPPANFTYPYIGLAISGGHTSLYRIEGLGDYRVLGHTIDDAAGEAFDKFAKMIGLGFPGGIFVDQMAALGGDPRKYSLPRALITDKSGRPSKDETLNFSFSGLKTAAQRLVEGLPDDRRLTLRAELSLWHNILGPSAASDLGAGLHGGILADLCASFQEAIVDVLLARLGQAVRASGLRQAVLTGGVSANSRLRARARRSGRTLPEFLSSSRLYVIAPIMPR